MNKFKSFLTEVQGTKKFKIKDNDERNNIITKIEKTNIDDEDWRVERGVIYADTKDAIEIISKIIEQ